MDDSIDGMWVRGLPSSGWGGIYNKQFATDEIGDWIFYHFLPQVWFIVMYTVHWLHLWSSHCHCSPNNLVGNQLCVMCDSALTKAHTHRSFCWVVRAQANLVNGMCTTDESIWDVKLKSILKVCILLFDLKSIKHEMRADINDWKCLSFHGYCFLCPLIVSMSLTMRSTGSEFGCQLVLHMNKYRIRAFVHMRY